MLQRIKNRSIAAEPLKFSGDRPTDEDGLHTARLSGVAVSHNAVVGLRWSLARCPSLHVSFSI